MLCQKVIKLHNIQIRSFSTLKLAMLWLLSKYYWAIFIVRSKCLKEHSIHEFHTLLIIVVTWSMLEAIKKEFIIFTKNVISKKRSLLTLLIQLDLINQPAHSFLKAYILLIWSIDLPSLVLAEQATIDHGLSLIFANDSVSEIWKYTKNYHQFTSSADSACTRSCLLAKIRKGLLARSSS